MNTEIKGSRLIFLVPASIAIVHVGLFLFFNRLAFGVINDWGCILATSTYLGQLAVPSTAQHSASEYISTYRSFHFDGVDICI